jgi:hypothetical protein
MSWIRTRAALMLLGRSSRLLVVGHVFFSTQALFSSLAGRHSPNFPKLPKTFQSGWSWLGVAPASQYVKKARRFHLVLPIPVLVHLTGSVLDGDAPFGSNVLHAILVVKGWHGSCSEPIN